MANMAENSFPEWNWLWIPWKEKKIIFSSGFFVIHHSTKQGNECSWEKSQQSIYKKKKWMWCMNHNNLIVTSLTFTRFHLNETINRLIKANSALNTQIISSWMNMH